MASENVNNEVDRNTQENNPIEENILQQPPNSPSDKCGCLCDEMETPIEIPDFTHHFQSLPLTSVGHRRRFFIDPDFVSSFRTIMHLPRKKSDDNSSDDESDTSSERNVSTPHTSNYEEGTEVNEKKINDGTTIHTLKYGVNELKYIDIKTVVNMRNI
uniref:Uncharacterized protein n=1 Tax=Parastrongyloides trichosuri TaxID=131310 RepID=A0A0N4Z4F4_PARTI